MRYIVIGAGAVGGSIGGRLRESGQDVVLVARGAHGAALRDHGLRLATPDGVLELPGPAVDGPEALELRPDDVLVLAVKTQDSVAALDAWAARPVVGGGTAGEVLPLVCAQNGVVNERLALRRFRRVHGMCVWLPSQYLRAGTVVAPCAPLTGMLHLGLFPGGVDDTVRRIAADLEGARFLAPVVPDVMRWKYAKLLANLANALEAACGEAIRDGEDAGRAQELLGRARTEGTTVLAAAGIDWATEAELAEVRDGRMEMRPVAGAERGGGSSWQSLIRGTGSIEADYLNGEIVQLGRLHGVPTPVNETLQRVANDCAREGRRPGSLSVAELTGLVDPERD
ncbi:2-dehydropantoate 2-reductase N-terminal domain-containing protein [Streptomyces sp. ACA25]|uniref:ketopantoate reductase family protein n=1 Tax=Streptomyces sp. ACA25 TaxID=3022596 RepID=UPI00230749E0|nr:2-dehydropantoate 2-reductase N-terminal domain-containing protein [Streptomyces sp. ACA25]MDB1086376.1 2-dehydropantoate 2-reductase N-terminal domain-containing protein [Streptomyces sp. ACA25]